MSTFECPVPLSDGERVLLAHGEGGRLSRQLIRDVFLDAFDNQHLRTLSDAAVVPNFDGRIAVTTDSYVVSPLFFPGGDIGKLAVHGTVNDLAVCGAEPLFLTAAFILEEGFALDTLKQVVQSMSEAARASDVQVVTGDTKVVPRRSADGLFINTTGVGRLPQQVDVGPHRVEPGDRILVSGTIGDHGIAVLSARERLGFETPVASDTGSIATLAKAALRCEVHSMRDPTRGGVAAVLQELSEATGLSLVVDETRLPVHSTVRGACELLGLDPLHVANEGKLVAIVSERDADLCLDTWRRHPAGQRGAIIGEVGKLPTSQVLIQNAFGITRVLDQPTGAPLPRIC